MSNEPTNDQPFTTQPGDILMLLRLEPDSITSLLTAQDAILAALRVTGLLPKADPSADADADAREIAASRRRARLKEPVVRRLGRSGWA
ncbi:hypothetical protein ACWDYH_17140 [Nocardia goodfellowii]